MAPPTTAQKFRLAAMSLRGETVWSTRDEANEIAAWFEQLADRTDQRVLEDLKENAAIVAEIYVGEEMDEFEREVARDRQEKGGPKDGGRPDPPGSA